MNWAGPVNPWLRLGLVIGSCAIGGFGLGVLVAAVVVKRITDEVLGT